MIEIADIKDKDSLREWLTDWPKENGLDEDAARAVAAILAYRMSMRVLPLWWEWTLTDHARELDLTALPILRCNLISGVAAFVPTPEIKRAAAAAYTIATAIATTTAATTTAAPAAAPAAIDATIATTAAAAAANTATASAATTAATTAAAAIATTAVAIGNIATTAIFWEEIRTDCERIAGKLDVFATPLWNNRENPYEPRWSNVKSRITAPEWAFWIKWYDDALAGTPPNWDMLEQIALIEPEVWEEGVEAVAKRIKEIESDFPIAAPVKKNALAVQQAVARNLAAIPPQVDALIATIDAEIERLRGKNPQDDVEQSEIDRLRQTFETMRDALVALSEKLPDKGEPSIADAEEMEGLLDLYKREFMMWPRENAADLVDSSCRVVLIGLTAGVLTAFGLPGTAATAVAGIAYGGKKLVGIGKVLKDAVTPDD